MPGQQGQQGRAATPGACPQRLPSQQGPSPAHEHMHSTPLVHTAPPAHPPRFIPSLREVTRATSVMAYSATSSLKLSCLRGGKRGREGVRREEEGRGRQQASGVSTRSCQAAVP